MPEPLDEELAWEPDWPCPTCTLLNRPEAVKCAACESFRGQGTNTSGVVVVLPREDGERPKRPVDDTWACPACTLVNAASETQCGACGGERWIQKRPMTAAALRARREAKRVNTSDEHGIWGGLGPDREFLPLPPAPEGRVIYRSAKDNDLDIFADQPVTEQNLPNLPEPGGGANSSENDPQTPQVVTDPVGRPAWRVEGDPLFSSTDATLLGIGESALFEDAVWRLAASGFEHTKCHLALEAAGGDEDLARTFLAGLYLEKSALLFVVLSKEFVVKH